MWSLEDVPPGSSTEITTGTETLSSCDFDPDTDGSYRLKLVTNGGGPGNIQVLICAVTRDNSGNVLKRGWRVPAIGEQGNEGNFGGQTRGWDESMRFMLDDIRENAFDDTPSGGGGGGDDGASERVANFTTRASTPTLLTDLPTGSDPVTGVAIVDSIDDTNESPHLYYVAVGMESQGLRRVDLLTGEQENVLHLDDVGKLYAYGNMLLVVGEGVCYINPAPSAENLYEVSPASGTTGFDGLATVGIASASGTTYWYITVPDDNTVSRVALNPGGNTTAAVALSGFVSPKGITTDDAGNIWVASKDDPLVQKYTIGPSGNLTASGAPVAARVSSNLVFDGKYIFGAASATDDDPARLVRINPADGSVTFKALTYVDSHTYLAFDGSRLWLTGSHRTLAVHPETLDTLVNLNGTTGDAHGQLIVDPKTFDIYVALEANGGSNGSILDYSQGHYTVLDGLRLRSVTNGQFLRADPDTGEIIGVAQGVVVPLELDGTTDTVELTVKGAPGQTANYQEWRSSGGALKAAVTAAGTMLLAALGLGVVQSDGSGLLSSSALDLSNASLVTNRLDENNFKLGGTNTVLGSNGTTNAWTASPIIDTKVTSPAFSGKAGGFGVSLDSGTAGQNIDFKIGGSTRLSVVGTTLVPQESSAFAFTHAARTTDSPTFDLTVRSQAPYASAVTNRNSANLVFDVPAAATGGTTGFHRFTTGGVQQMVMQPFYQDGTQGGPTIWIHDRTPTVNNFTISMDSHPAAPTADAALYFNTPTIGSPFYFFTGGGGRAQLDYDGTSHRFLLMIGKPGVIGMQARTNDAAVNDLTIQGQTPFVSATGANRNAGNVIIAIPTPASGGTRGYATFTNDTATVLQVGRRSNGDGSLWMGGVSPSDTNFTIRSTGTTTLLNSPTALTMSLQLAGATAFVFQQFSGANHISFRQDQGASIDQTNQASDIPTFDMVMLTQKGFSTATGTNRNSGNLLLQTNLAVNGGTTVGRIALQPGQLDAFAADTSTHLTLFGGPTWTTGTAAPSSSEVDGSRYTRTGSPNGNEYLRRNGAWLSFLDPAAGLFTLPGLVLGGANQVIWSDGSLNQWTGAPVLSTSLGFAKSAVSPSITHAAQTTDTACTDVTIAAQAPFASATGSNRNPGNVVVAISPAASGGTEGFVKFTWNGIQRAAFGINTIGASNGFLFLGTGSPVATGTGNNPTLFGNGSTITALNCKTGGALFLQLNGISYWKIDETPKLEALATSAALLQHGSQFTDAAPPDFTIRSSAPFASASTNKAAGNLVLDIPAPVSGGGESFVKVTRGGTVHTQFGQFPGLSGWGTVWYGNVTPTSTNWNVASDGASFLGFSLINANGGFSFSTTTSNTQLLGIQVVSGENKLFFGTNATAAAVPARITMAGRTTDTATADLNISSMVPYASATGTNRNPGGIVLEIASAASGGAEGFVTIKTHGAVQAQIGERPGLTGFAGLWLGPITPATTNYALQSNGTTLTQVQSGTADGQILFIFNGRSAAAFTDTNVANGINGLMFQADKPYTIGHRRQFADAACPDLTVQSSTPFATATGSNRNPGNLILAIPAPITGGVDGFVKFSISGNTRGQVGVYPLDTTYGSLWLGGVTPGNTNYALAANGAYAFINGTSGVVISKGDVPLAWFQQFSGANHMSFANDQPASIDFINLASDTAAHDITIQSQPPYASASTNTSPGAVILSIPAPVGAGTNNYVKVAVGGTNYAYVGKGGIAHYGYLYLGDNGPTNTNYNLISNGSSGTIISGPNETGTGGWVGIASAASIIGYFARAAVTGIGASPGFWFDNRIAYTLAQTTQTSDTATFDLTIQSQAPFASSTGSNRNSGNLVFDVPAAASGGTLGLTKFTFGGTAKAYFGASSTSAGSGYLFMGTTTPVFAGGAGVGNYALAGDGANSLVVNAPAASASIIFTVANNTRWSLLDARIQATSVQAAEIAHNGRTSDASTFNFTLRAQAPFASATGSNRNPGNLVYIIPAPISGGTAGKHSFQVSDAEVLAIGLTTMSMSSSFNKITTAATELVLEQTGDALGTSRFHLQNRSGVAGALFENAGIDVVDIICTGTSHTGAVRMEGRAGSTFLSTQPEWQIGASAGNPTLVVNTVATGIGFRTPLVQFIKDQASPKIFQAPQTTDTACFDLTLESQTPYASATGTNRNPGNLVYNVPAPASGGATGKHSFKISGTEVLAIDRLNGSTIETTIPTDNYRIYIANAGAYFQLGTVLAYFDATTLNFRNASGGTTYGNVTSTGWRFGDGNAATEQLEVVGNQAFAKTVTPILYHLPQTTDVATHDFTVKSQGPYASATGTNRNPGNLVLEVPAAASGGTEGKISFKIAGSERAKVGSDGSNAAFISIGANPASIGAARFPNNTGFYGRNAANSGDILMLQLNTSDAVNVGDSNTAGVNINTKTGTSVQMTVNSTGYLIVSSTSVRDAHIASAGLAHFDNVGNFSSSLLVDADVSNTAAISGYKLGFPKTTITGTATISSTTSHAQINITSEGTYDITLPAATDGKFILITIKSTAGVCHLNPPAGGATISGMGYVNLNNVEALALVADGTDWRIVGFYTSDVVTLNP